jgi:putative tricarboxylic transport membrane protein
MKRLDVLGSLVWILVGGVFCAGAFQYRLFRGNVPGAGFLPFLASVSLIVLALVVLVSACRAGARGAGPAPESRFFPRPDSWQKVTVALGALLAYWAALQYLGFPITTFLFLAFLLRWIEPQKWVVTLLTALFATTGSYLLFDLWLKVRLPKGILGM